MTESLKKSKGRCGSGRDDLRPVGHHPGAPEDLADGDLHLAGRHVLSLPPERVCRPISA